MEKGVVVTCAIVGLLGALSAALGFAAEGTKVKASQVQQLSSGKCMYPKSYASQLALAAAMALVMAQTIINIVAGCICCKPRVPGSNWNNALIYFIMSWVTFVIAFFLLLIGAAVNNRGNRGSVYFADYCYVIKHGVFSGAAILSFASISFGIIYYVTLSSMKFMEPSLGQQQAQGIVMGQPQIPPQSAQPVFVHEDTYNRRQIP